ncbi:MAG: SRPBCC domain-containing protein [Planctomycetes bacterium]|nr:SRPBCC domain-containing protein [Planctomycetota bacterium]
MNLIEHTLEIGIAAPPPRVWKALTGQVSSWWHPRFFTREGALAFVVEPHVGGRLYEDWGDGTGLLWYTVAGVTENELLQLWGDIDSRHGGPARLHTTFRLRAEGNGSVLRLEECAFGKVDEKLRKSLEKGWRILIDGCLKVFVETGKPPREWPAF